MKPSCGQSLSKSRCAAAFTLIDALGALAVIVILAGLLLPYLARPRTRSSRIGCVSNLKQIGLSFRMWSGDGGDKYPMAMQVSQGGTLEVANEVWRSFQVMSNEIFDPRVLVCPADAQRKAAANFTNGFGNQHISYFIGLDASETSPDFILLGDRNLTNGQPVQNHVLNIFSNTPVGWSGEMHGHQGNIGLADSSVQQVNQAKLRSCVDAALAARHSAGLYSGPPVTNDFLRLAVP